MVKKSSVWSFFDELKPFGLASGSCFKDDFNASFFPNASRAEKRNKGRLSKVASSRVQFSPEFLSSSSLRYGNMITRAPFLDESGSA